jgi:hypothetical protein
MDPNTPDQTSVASESSSRAHQPPTSSPFQVYQRLGHNWLDDAARELPRPQFVALMNGLRFRTKLVHGVQEDCAA